MFIAIDAVLTPAETGALREAVAALPFEDGRATAGAIARKIKHNEQAAKSNAREAVIEKVRKTLLADATFVSAARPRHFARLLVSRYRGGQTYGLHVDDALMAGTRTDLAFTLFLSEPDTYEGGALEIEDTLETRSLRLPAGSLILYPANTLHRVAPVTSGERLAVVGWVESWLRDAGQREVLYDLDRAIATLAARKDDDPVLALLTKSRSNLLRMWAGA